MPGDETTNLVAEEDLSSIVEALERFVEREVLTRERALGLEGGTHPAHDADGRFTDDVLAARREIRIQSAKAGFYTLLGSQSLGGGGLGAAGAVYVQEALNRRFGPPRVLLHDVVLPSPFTNGLTPLLRFVPQELLDRHVDAIAAGEVTLCFALSEPGAGSDAFGISTRAERDGDGWVITGQKQWITNSPYADFAFVFAVTDAEKAAARTGGITCFFVDTTTPGFTATAMKGLMGNPGSDLGEIALDSVRVPSSHVVGEVGSGLKVALTGIDRGRLSMAASSTGQAQWALAQAVEYASARESFGRPIGDHQAVQLLLADAAIDIHASKSMVVRTAAAVDAGRPAIKEVCMVKAFATEMLFRVADRCIQVYGAAGLTNELGIERLLRHARIMRIPDGTGEIQRRTIARQLLGGDLSF